LQPLTALIRRFTPALKGFYSAELIGAQVPEDRVKLNSNAIFRLSGPYARLNQ
jgi:hypothetical protein